MFYTALLWEDWDAMKDIHYFDNAATTRISAAALESYTKSCLNHPGNPSAAYRLGHEAKDVLEDCRRRAAAVLSVQPGQLVFTSGATESIGIVMSSLLWAKAPGQVLISSLEHEAVAAWAPMLKEKGWDVVTVRAKKGLVSPEALEAEITAKTRLVAVMAVSNSLGTIQDTKALSEVVRRKEAEYGRPITFLSDSVQALGKTGLDLSLVDAASFSAHKVHGPRGVGLLYLKKGQLQPLSHGGGQERGLRPGTENLAGIEAFTTALEELDEEDARRIRSYSDEVREAIKGSKVKALVPADQCSGHILALSTPIPSEVAVRMLQDRGVLVSSGSACSNNARGKAEAVLRASGFAEAAGNMIRVSFSRDNDEDDIRALIEALGSF